MKITAHILIVCCIFSITSIRAGAQFKAGANVIIKSGASVTIDSLNLEPTADLDLSRRTITVSHTPIDAISPGSNGSIAHVITIAPQMTYKGTLGLLYDDAELNGNTPALLNLQYMPETGPTGNINLVTISNSGNQVTGITGINTIDVYKLTAVDGGVILPLHLLSFSAKPEGKKVLLKWESANEQNLSHYDVEKSNDSRNFSFMKKMMAKGNDLVGRFDYAAYDLNPQTGWNYYRLKMTDNDNVFSFSPVAAVSFRMESTILLYPNPTTSLLHLTMDAGKDYIEYCSITDATGRLMSTVKLDVKNGNNSFIIDLSSLAAGSYLLTLQSGFTAKVVKN